MSEGTVVVKDMGSKCKEVQEMKCLGTIINVRWFDSTEQQSERNVWKLS